MKNSNQKTKNPISIALYIVSALFGIYTILTVYNSYSYITTLTALGLVISEELLNVISYFVENSAPYIFYALATWAMGYIISKVNYISNNIKIDTNEEIEEEIIAKSNEPTLEEKVEAIEEEIVTSDEDNDIDDNNNI